MHADVFRGEVYGCLQLALKCIQKIKKDQSQIKIRDKTNIV